MLKKRRFCYRSARVVGTGPLRAFVRPARSPPPNLLVGGARRAEKTTMSLLLKLNKIEMRCVRLPTRPIRRMVEASAAGMGPVDVWAASSHHGKDCSNPRHDLAPEPRTSIRLCPSLASSATDRTAIAWNTKTFPEDKVRPQEGLLDVLVLPRSARPYKPLTKLRAALLAAGCVTRSICHRRKVRWCSYKLRESKRT